MAQINAKRLSLCCGAVMLILRPSVLQAETPGTPDLAQQIVDALFHAPGVKQGFRPVHAKGVVVHGTFTPSSKASSLSRAAHFSGGAVPVTVRFSDGAADPGTSDIAPDSAPRGMAIRFGTGAAGTDIVCISHNGFLVGTGEEFLALLKAQSATNPSLPHPWPIEEFLQKHPNARKFVQDAKPVPVSFATETYYSNNAFLFVNKKGVKRAGRYQIVPVAGAQYLSDEAVKAQSADFLTDELRSRFARGPAKFRLLLQLAGPGDRTGDSSTVWPDDRAKVDLGTITLSGFVTDRTADLAFDPARLTDGIELSDDPLPALRSRAYAISAAMRHKK